MIILNPVSQECFCLNLINLLYLNSMKSPKNHRSKTKNADKQHKTLHCLHLGTSEIFKFESKKCFRTPNFMLWPYRTPNLAYFSKMFSFIQARHVIWHLMTFGTALHSIQFLFASTFVFRFVSMNFVGDFVPVISLARTPSNVCASVRNEGFAMLILHIH